MFLNKPDLFQNGYKMVSLSSKIARYKIFVNVGGAEMAFNGGDERIAFGPMAKGQKKYGATSSRLKRSEQVVVYNVQRGDTLQGIAIKFGVHTEQIRRVNHLWTNDSLFLRDKLLIPVVDVQGNESNGGEHRETNSDANSSFGNSSNLSSPAGEEGGFKMQPHWSHPLCDSFEEDCMVSPGSMKLGGSTTSNPDFDSSAETWCSSKESPSTQDKLNSSNNSAIGNGVHAGHPPYSESKSKHSTMDSRSSYQDSSNDFNVFSTNPETPTSPSSSSSSRQCTIVDQSEKSAEEFLSRIDNAIASSKMQAKTKSERDKAPWVTFDSDSESDHRQQSSGTSITRQGRHLRYSLRKLEKAQDELFQL